MGPWHDGEYLWLKYEGVKNSAGSPGRLERDIDKIVHLLPLFPTLKCYKLVVFVTITPLEKIYLVNLNFLKYYIPFC